MQMKKLALALLMVSSLALAQETEKEVLQEKEALKGKGFFMGMDVESISVNGRYSGSLYSYDNDDTKTEPAFKVGYQYYFTRIYFKYSKLDESYSAYSVDSDAYEINLEYIPVIYRPNSYVVRLIVGGSIGYTDNKMHSLNPSLFDHHKLFGLQDFSQKEALYGAQIGLMVELPIGLSAEIGYRYRRGNLLEFTDDTGDITIETKRKQVYFGLNYMF